MSDGHAEQKFNGSNRRGQKDRIAKGLKKVQITSRESKFPRILYTKEYAANIAAANAVCETTPGYTVWRPDMRRDEQKIIFAIPAKW
jgi:hypothetical protein